MESFPDCSSEEVERSSTQTEAGSSSYCVEESLPTKEKDVAASGKGASDAVGTRTGVCLGGGRFNCINVEYLTQASIKKTEEVNQLNRWMK